MPRERLKDLRGTALIPALPALLALFAGVVSVDVTPEAWELLTGSGDESAWVSGVYYT
ncbi:MAG: hypothetical protein GX256_02100 [Fretibacterium sp.]|nr:hypothetical protein [Fretibacterium sp.]